MIDKIGVHISNNATVYSKLFLTIGFLCALSSSLSTPSKLWNDCYYHLFEMSFMFYLTSMYLLITNHVKYSEKWVRFALFVLMCSCSTLVDELFYDAKIVEWNDLIRIIMIGVFSYKIKLKKWRS